MDFGYFCNILKDSKVGERVTLEGYDKISQEKAAAIDPKKHKVLENVLPSLKTDATGFAKYLGSFIHFFLLIMKRK